MTKSQAEKFTDRACFAVVLILLITALLGLFGVYILLSAYF